MKKRKLSLWGCTWDKNFHPINHYFYSILYWSSEPAHRTRKSNERMVKKRKKKTKCMPLAVTSPSSYPQLLATTNLLSISIDLPILDIWCIWNHVICGPLWLATFTQHNVFNVHLCCGIYWYFIPFYNEKNCLSIHQRIDNWVVSTFGYYD